MIFEMPKGQLRHSPFCLNGPGKNGPIPELRDRAIRVGTSTLQEQPVKEEVRAWSQVLVKVSLIDMAGGRAIESRTETKITG